MQLQYQQAGLLTQASSSQFIFPSTTVIFELRLVLYSGATVRAFHPASLFSQPEAGHL
jgi:hypothetical protein